MSEAMQDMVQDLEVGEAEISEGVTFLMERGLLAEVEPGSGMLGLTQDGMTAMYMMSMVLAAGLTRDEIASGQVAESTPARTVSLHARHLLGALDGMLTVSPVDPVPADDENHP